MFKKIKQLLKITLVSFLTILLFVGVLTIWDIIDNKTAKEIFEKVSYTFGVILIFSSVIMYITDKKE